MDSFVCIKCGQRKPIDMFYVRGDGRKPTACAECESKYVMRRVYPPVMIGTKFCPKCGIEKDITEFSKTPHHVDGRHSNCGKCEYEIAKLRRSKLDYSPSDVGSKMCTRCKETKPLTDFYARKVNPDGRASECKNCNCVSHRQSTLLRKYGLSPLEYSNLYNEMGGKCGICGTKIDLWFSHLCVDHDHTTGKVRGLLCKPCNLVLGNAKDDIHISELAISYLRKSMTI